ncbi:MAG: hypothetical protein IJO67_09650 [Clostridia bacterium]|nr:hypothetical protein [Clostridia bacterium]
MKKSTLVMILCLALAVAMGVGSTMAYLQDTDEDVNVMTLGNVYIEQHEYERVEQTNSGNDELKEFVQGKPLYPAVGDAAWVVGDNGRVYQKWPTGGSSALFDAEKLNNVVDKMVFVENTGSSDAYIRTIFAFELADGWDVSAVRDDMIHLNFNESTDTTPGHYVWTWLGEPVEIDGQKYAIAEALYVGSSTVHTNGVLPAGETSRPSLLQVFLDSKATNKDIESLGETYDILVVSQAVQTQGFADAKTALDTAFGVISEKSHPWMDLDGKTDEEGDQDPDGAEFPVLVSTADELVAAIAAGGDVYLTDDIDIGEEAIVIAKDNEVTLNLNGKKLTGANDSVDSCYMIDNKGKLTINGDGVIDFASTCDASGSIGDGYYTITNTGDLTINGGVIKNSSNDGWLVDGGMGKIATAIDHKAGNLTINDGTIESTYRSLRVAPFGGNVVAEINGGKFVGQVWVQNLNGSKTSVLTVNGGEYGPVGSDGSSIFVNNIDGKATAVINDGIFNTKIGANALTGFVKGGTFATQDAYDTTNAALFAADNTVTVK